MRSTRGVVQGFLDRIRTIVPAGSSSRRAQAAPPFKRKPLFESLEQRLLLSADIAPAAATGLVDGMQELRDWAGGLQAYGALSQALPVGQGADPISIGAALDLATLFDQKLFAPVQAYLGGAGQKTTDGLVGALGAVAGITSVSGDQFGDELRFDVVLDVNKALPGLKINIGATQDGTQVTTDADGTVDATGGLLLDFSFGLDLDTQLAPQEAFFIDIDTFEASVDAAETGLDFGANIGFLGANVANGSFNLDAALAVGLNNPDNDAEGKITLAELLGTTLEGLVAFTPTGSFNANFPISVTLGAFTPANTALTVAGNPLDPSTLIVNVAGTNAEDILNFGRANKFIVAEALQQLSGWLDSLNTSDAFAQAFPFAQGTDFSDVLNLGQAFTEGFLDQLEAAPGVPVFDNAQQFAQKIADLMFGGDTSPVALNYNPSTNQLTFHLRLDRTFADVQTPVGFSVNLAPLGGLSSSSTLAISADGRIEFTVGFDLSPFLATWLSSTDLPLNGVLSADASFLVRVNDATQPTLVTVARDTANTTRSALITDINAAIQAAGVTGLTATLQGARLRFNVTGNALGANLQFSVPNDATNPAKSELGLPVVGFAGDGLTSKTFLRDIRVTGHAEFSAADVDATAAFGIFEVGIVNGTVSGEATVDVQVRKSGNPAIPIYMGELYQAVNLIPSYTSITKSGSVSGNLPIALQGPSVISLPGSPRVQFSMSNVFQPGTLTVTLQDLAPLTAYQNFDAADVIAGLNSLANFFNSVEGFSFLNQKLPLLDRSVTDLVSFVDNFQSAVTSLTNAGPITLQQLEQKLEQALGVSAGALSMSLTATDLLIQLNIVEQLPAGLQQMAMDLNLASLAGGNPNLSGVGHLIDVGGSAKLNVSAAAELDLNFGFDLTTPSNPRPYIRDDSSLALTARVSGSNLDFDAAIGPLGLFIRDGVVRLDNGVGVPAAFTLAFNPATGGKWYSNQWGTGIVNAAVIGQAHATLPVYFPLATNLLGTIQLDIGNLASIAATTTVTAPNIAAEIQAINLFDDMDALVQGIDLILAGIQDAMDGEFLGLELPIIGDSLKDQAKFVETLRQELKTALSAAFGSGATSAIAVQEALFDALGPAGLDVLPDVVNEASDIAFQRFNDAQGKAERIEFDLQLHQDEGIEVPIAFDIGLPGLGLAAAANSAVKLALAYDMRLGFGVSRSQGVYLKTYDTEDELKLGVSASLDNAAFGGTLGFLRVRIEDDAANQTQLFGGVTLNLIDPDDRITFNELAGGANLGNMLDIDFELTAEANLHLEAGAPNFQVTDPASASFFLQEFPRVEAEFNLLWTFTPGGPATGTLERAELNDVRLNLGTFFSGFLGPIFDVLDPILEAAAPLIDVLTEPLPVFSDIAGRDYTLIDLAQDVNSVTNFISPEALDFIEAMVIILDVIEDIDSFGGDGVYIEFGGIDLKTFDLKNPSFSFGNFGANQNPFQGKQINTPGTSLPDQLQDKASGFAQKKSSIKGTGGSGFSIPLIDNPLRVFDLLLGRDVELFRYDMPEFAFEFSHRWKFGPVYAPPPVYVTLSGGIKAGFNFGFGYDTSGLRKMFEQAQDGGPVNPLLIFDGFFVADWDAAGNERAEAYIEGKIGAGAEVSAIIVSVGAEGGIFARVGLDLHDPNNDGRMHGYEILSELAGGGGPICLFDFVGEIGAFLQIFVEIGISPFSFTFEMEIARVTLIDWTIDICHEPPPILATQVGDELFLNMGPRAGERVHGDIVDDDEAFVVKNLADGTVMVEAFGFTQVYGKYKLDADGELIEAGTAITKIIADGGAMNDSIEIEANVPMITDLKGGAGDDVLIAGGGAAFIQGGAGKDTIYGSAKGDQLFGDTQDGSGAQGDDIIHGGQGNDVVFGGGGVDYVYGELGDDEIHGGDGADLLFGQEGRDHIFGDAGEDGIFGGVGADQLEGGGDTDYLVGGDAEAGMRDELYGDYEFGTDDDARDYLWGDEAAGQLPEALADFVAPGTVTFADDLLFGQGGSDYLYGEAGLDEIFGGAGDDFIFGGSGNDLIRGEIGNDDISGGSGEDLVYGGLGNDTIRGDQDNDLVYGEAGADFILGGSGEDTLYGGADNDLIRGQEGDDQVYGDAGNDDLHGDAGQDLLVGGLGNDILTGGAHEDRLHGSDGDDTLFGSAGADYLYGEAGADAIFGNSGDDYLDGGSGADSLFGGAGADTLMAGTGLGKQLFGDAGDDLIVGAADGREDLDLLDATYFGDLIHGGSGNDLIHGLSGADVIHGDAGDDEIWGGAHGDRLLGGEGFDRLYGGIGADRIEGGADGDYLDGGFDADLLFGDAGDDEILGGGGADEISGGAGDDVLRGSDDAPDTIHGDAGRDRIFGNGGNDALFGDTGDDILDGGLGDDVIEGGLGSDVLLGGAQHDNLYGHSASGSGDDAAVDYLYGDFGTNLNDAGAGNDRLFGQGGNDVLFGEGGDDFIDAGGGASNLVSFGAGEGANPADFVTPVATPNPSLNAPADEPYALPQLPAGLTPGGRWTEFLGSASGEGVSSSQAAAIEPALAIDANGNRYLAWADARNGNYEIYVLRHTGSGWEMLAGSAEGKGISASIGESRRPSIAIDADGNPIVAWAERNYSVLGVTSNIKVAKFDPAADGGAGAWVALGESLDGNGISNSGLADNPTVLITAGGPVVTWLDSVSGTRQVYAKRFAAGAWSAFGTNGASAGGVSNAPVDVAEYAAATNGNEVAVTFSRLAGSDHEVYLTRSGGGAWGAPGNAAIGNGLSDNVGESRNPTVAYHDGSIFVAWQDQGSLRQEIFARRLDGNAWVPAGTDAAQGQGVSATTGFAATPKLAVAGDELFLMWADHSVIDRPDNAVSLFAKRWTGSAFAQPLDGDAANRGISPTARQVQSFALALDADGRPFVAWSAANEGAPQIYLRGDTLANATVHQVANLAALQALLAGGALGANDIVLLASGYYNGTVTIGADDSGVTIVGDGAQDSVFSGTVNIDGASGVTLARIRFTGDVNATNTSGLTLVDNEFVDAPLSLSGGTDLKIIHNRFAGDGGIVIAAAAAGRITYNDIGASGTGLAIDAAFTGLIDHNDIHGASVGVVYNAAAALAANRIHGNATGVRATVSGANALGFVAGSASNEIYGNATGIELQAAGVQGQHVFENSTGVSGSGTIGGDSLTAANLIERNGTGVGGFTGTVQFSRIAHNTVGIQATNGLQLLHSLIYRNAEQGLNIAGVADVRVYQNTFHAPSGDNIRLSAGASNVEVRGNILWAESGYDIYVANDSQSGFFSDYNDLYVTGGGRIGYWTKDFVDVLDWQADIAKFDLHSIGHTVIDPTWARPQFLHAGSGDYRLFAPVAGLRFTSPTVDAADARMDTLRPANEVNLLANPGFEGGVSGWVTNVGGTVRSANPAAFEGGSYYSAGNIEEGFAEQVIDLIAEGYSAAQLDLSDLEVVFSGRLRSLAESPADRGKVRIIFLSGTGTELGRVEADAHNESTRWELVGARSEIPVGTRSIAFRFIADRDSGTSNDAFFDHAFLGIVSENVAPDIGAYGHAATDVGLAATPRVNLRFPDLYTDWEKDKPLTIRWETFGNTSDAPVRIDLYQDGPDGPALRATIALATPDDGEHIWIPSSNGVDFATYGLRIQVSLTTNALVLDRSTETFTVPEDGNQYWVDDLSNANDAYTPAATGSNRHTGKLPTAPKPNPVNLVRTYALDAGSTLFIDAGTYPMIYPVSVSGTFDLGLGLDEGFRMTGPNDPASIALLLPAIPGDRSRPLIELNDADFVTIEHLSLANALRGLDVANGSDSFTATWLTAYGHAADGLRINTDAPFAAYHHLTAYGNTGRGIYIDGPIASFADGLAYNNTTDGIYITGAVGLFSDSIAYDNGQTGLDVQSPGAGARIEGNTAYGNNVGLQVFNSGSGAQAIVGTTDLTTGRGNLVYGNRAGGISAAYNTRVSGNTVRDQTNTTAYGISTFAGASISSNVISGNYYGISISSGGDVSYNRVYDNAGYGIYGYAGEFAGNVVYSNPVNLYVNSNTTVRNNLIYDSVDYGILIPGTSGTKLVNNTVYAATGDAIRVQQNASNVELRNNIVFAGGGYGVSVDSASQSGFKSDYNLFFTAGAGVVGLWQGVDRTGLTAWRNATFGDKNSLFGDPLFVDADGADGAIGYVSPANDGRDDDFHIRSQYGSFKGTALAPVRDAISGLPVFVPVPAATLDAATSPALDRGAPSDAFGLEPANNGGYINIGAYGNTAQASRSPAQYMLVTNPNGGEAVPQESTFDIRWRSTGFGGNVAIDLGTVPDAGGSPAWTLIADNEANDGSYLWSVDPALYAIGDSYLIRVRSVDVGAIQDQSDTTFAITLPISVFYVNDDSVAGDQYTTAIGNDGNDGLTPATPKATIRSVLETYDLDPGDVIRVDTGNYLLTANIVLEAQDSGVAIEGPTLGGARAVINRGNTASTSFVFQMAGADDVTLRNLAVTGAYHGIYAGNNAGSDRLVVEDSELFGNNQSGAAILDGNNDVSFDANEVYQNGSWGLNLGGSGNRATGNHVWGNGGGIVASYNGQGARIEILDNRVHDNNSDGINGAYWVLVSGNSVYGNAGTYGISMYSSRSLTIDNEIFRSPNGLNLSVGAVGRDNRIYDNTGIGIHLTGGGGGVAEGNFVYANSVGIQESQSRVANNLVYDNATAGIVTSGYRDDAGDGVINNTVVQPTGDAIRVASSAQNVLLRNNVLEVGSGYAINVPANAQSGFSSDYNLFRLSGSGQIGFWEDRGFATLTDWYYEIGLDAESLTADPQFIDPAGANGVRGYSRTNVGAALIIDDGDAGFSTIGAWTETVGALTVPGDPATPYEQAIYNTAYGHDIHEIPAAGNAGAVARWSFDGLEDGTYQIAVRWPTGSGFNAQNVQYRSYDGTVALGNIVGYTVLHQGNAINDFSADGTQWERLDTVEIRNGRLIVEMSDRGGTAQSRLTADAVRVQRIVGDMAADDDFHLAVGSRGVDRGDPASRYEREAVNNGARVDIGAYGNTAEATQSPAQLVQVLNPNGLEKYEAGQEVRIEFRSAGLTEFDPVLLMNLGGGALSGLGYWAAGDAPSFGGSSFNQSIPAAQAVDVSAPNAGPEELYRNYRGLNSGVGTTMGWQFEVPDGEYALRLHFIEPSYTSINQRRFEVSVQGTVVESDLDIYEEAGARYKALVREYAVTAAGGAGIELALENLTSAGAIISGVEILRLNAGGVANPTVDLEVSTDAGASWLPVAGGVALDRYGNGSFLWNAGPVANAALIRATAHAGAVEVEDISDVAFQIANAGTAYYVNDGATTGDEYTSAVGNNANDGKTPSTPMASLAALLRAYNLDAGDVIHVDTGVYNLATNIVLGAEDSGVTIRGPVLPTHDAVLDRGNTASNAHVFLFAGADDVTLEYLNVTGAYRAIVTNGATGNDRIALHFMDVYNNAAYGVDINGGNSDWLITDSRIHNNATYGIVSSGERLRVENNEIYGNNQGLVISAGSEAVRAFVIGNDVHDNSAIGINISSYVTARGNRAYNQTAGQGIYSYNASSLIEDNDAYNNAIGIQTGYQGSIVGNRSFDNGIGIRAYQGRIYGNQVYSNSTGIVEEGWGEVYNNLVYANTNRGIDVTYNHTSGERGVYNNTVWQDTGDAIRVDATNNVWLRNNLLSIGAGYAINVDADGQAGFSSDWNLFNLRTGAAFVGRWGASEQATLAAWQALSANHDANGIVGNPRFLDIDGADNVLGDQDVTTGDGYDDNFSLDADSAAIDAGSAYHAALTDIEGRERQDDPTTANTGIGWDRFVESLPGGSGYAETGTAIPLRTSNGAATVALPFTFEFYGASYTSVQVSVNGYLHFGGQDNVNTGDDNTQELFLRNVRIAPLWDNLNTSITQSDGSEGNVFVDSTVANQITIRWAAARQASGGGDANFSVTLFANGDVRFDYGDGNQALTPTVGLSAGNGFSFALSQYNGAADLNNAASVYFTRSEGLTYFDIGAYEFLGDSGDTLAPTVTSVSQLPAPGGSTAAAFSAIQVETSEALNSISAKSPANYDLRRAGADGNFDTPDDVIIPLRPSYSYPETNLTLEFLLGPNATPGILPDGDYRLTLSGTKAIYDLSGNPLDGNADGTGGDDYVRFFTVNRTNNVAPVANAQTVNVSEDASVVITLSASDANGDPLAYSLVSDPQHGVLSDFNPAARTVRYTPNAGYTGADSFQFSADDGNAGVGTATVTLNVQPINDAPVAADQSVTLEEDTPRLIVLDGIDTETERANLVFTLGVAPQHGSIVQGAAGGWTYTPDADYFGPDSFTYTVTDRGDPDGSLANVLTSAAATISITVTPVNDGPKLATVIDQVVAEGSILLVDVAATDPEGGADFEFSLDEAPAGAAIDAATGLFSWTPADGAQSAQVTVRVINAGFPGEFDTETFTINVTNVAPTVAITGAADAVQGQAYQIALTASDPGDDTIAQWEINWGDGQSSVLPGTATSASHVYALGGAAYSISAQASDEDGTFDSNTIEVAVAHDSLRVTSIEETVTGFKARFSHLIDPTVINLYSGEMPPFAPMGPADVQLFGAAKGAVRGSLVFDADGLGFTFVKTGGPLVADSYTLVLKSGSDAFRKAGSFDPLDGDSDGVAGGDFNDEFVVSAPTLPMLGIADFARGNLQPIDVPATAGGLPIALSDGTGIESIAFTLTLRHDAASPATDPMIVSAIELASGLPAGATLAYDALTNPGVIAISVTLPDGTTFGPGARSLVIVHATVGADAVYGGKQVLDIGDIAVNGTEGGALDDDGVQVVALLGDTSGDRDYAMLDVQRLQRTMVRYDSGFAAYPNADPIIIADINGNGMFSAVDAALLLQEVRFVNEIAATDRPEIPPIPAGVVPVDFVGPDPTVDLPRDLRAKPGDTITVPLRLDTAAGLDSARLRLAWDAQALELLAVERGSLTGDFQWYLERRGEGELYVDMSRMHALAAGSGSLIELRFRVAADAQPGVVDLDLTWASLDEGRLTLSPRPQPGPDGADGMLTIEGNAPVAQVSEAPATAVATPAVDAAHGPSLSIVQVDAPIPPAAMQSSSISVAPQPAPVAVVAEPTGPVVAPPASAPAARPGILGNLGEALRRRLLDTIAKAEAEPDVASIAPAVAMQPSWDGVQAPLRIDLAGGAADGWSLASFQSANDWLPDFVARDKALRDDANAELKVTLPRVAPQLAAAGGIAKAAARR